MFSRQNTNWNLIAKHLAGETGEPESSAMEKWLNKSPENRALFKQLRSDWKMMDTMNKQFNVDNAWNKLHGRIITHESFTGTKRSEQVELHPRGMRYMSVRIAASLLLAAVLGFSIVYLTGRFQDVTMKTTANERMRHIELPDGSGVFLNSDTRISYPKRFKHTREITLTGEAFFEISPDKSRPFLIHAEDADIRVLGTSFNVDTRSKAEVVEVYVASGIVELSEAENHVNHVLLHPGDLGTFSVNHINSTKSDNENPMAWKTGIMDFQDTRLSEAVKILNEIYRVNIVCLEPGLDTVQTNGTYHYPDESLDQILTILCTQNRMKVEKSDNKIYLSR
jgi:transmembrane sensor